MGDDGTLKNVGGAQGLTPATTATKSLLGA
jgi:hypothetical protein